MCHGSVGEPQLLPGRHAGYRRLGCGLCWCQQPEQDHRERVSALIDTLEVTRHLRITWCFLWVTVHDAGSGFPIIEDRSSGGSAAVAHLPIFSSSSAETQLTRILCKLKARSVMAGYLCVMPCGRPSAVAAWSAARGLWREGVRFSQRQCCSLYPAAVQWRQLCP